MDQKTQPPSSGLPIACNLSEPALIERRQVLAEEIFSGCEQVNELADGYEFRFPGAAVWIGKLAEFVAFERQCCPFFAFELAFTPNEGPILLRVRGEAGVKEFIRQELGPLPAHAP